jgi:hypothetical protein
MNDISNFIEQSLGDQLIPWIKESVFELSTKTLPDDMYRNRKDLLKADSYLLWAKWFVESLIDVKSQHNTHLTYGVYYKKLHDKISLLFPTKPKENINEITATISAITFKQIEINNNKKRENLSVDKRYELLDVASRCWYCGQLFCDGEIDSFLGFNKDIIRTKREFVDYLKPSGMSERDSRIEIEHRYPFCKGGSGGDNLVLACGWCNKNKSSRMSLYDVTSEALAYIHPRLGRVSVPQPFWVIRLISMKRRCEHTGGCNNDIDNSELTVVPIIADGSANMMNLRVVCPDHEGLGSNRFVHSSTYAVNYHD